MERRTVPAVVAVSVPVLVIVLLGGAWCFIAVLAPRAASSIGHGSALSIVFGVAWFLIASQLLRRLTARDRNLRITLRWTFLATALALSAFSIYTSERTTTVDETVATGVAASRLPLAVPSSTASAGVPVSAEPAPVNVEVASGRLHDIDESAAGRVAVVRLATGGRTLTLTDFASSNGPDVRVYLVAGAVHKASDVRDFRDLGGLKGNRGNQQYGIPADVDVQRYATVVIYCRALSVAFGAAALTAS
jgi:hypothetical protein